MIRAAIIVVALAGCSVAWDLPGVITPVGDDAWGASVERAASIWNAYLEPSCSSAPFAIGEGGYPVVLVDVDAWPSEYDDKAGLTFDDRILIRTSSDLARHIVLVHELGHAIGLEHSDDERSPMHSPAEQVIPTDRDLHDAYALLGCAP